MMANKCSLKADLVRLHMANICLFLSPLSMFILTSKRASQVALVLVFFYLNLHAIPKIERN